MKNGQFSLHTIPRQVHKGVNISCQTRQFTTEKKYFVIVKSLQLMLTPSFFGRFDHRPACINASHF
jgi:hypothetical protein